MMRMAIRRTPLRGALLSGAVALCLGALVWAHAVSAHGIVIESSPDHRATIAAPKQLVIRFNSRLEKALCTVTLVGAKSGQAMRLQGMADGPMDTLIYALPPLEPQTYQARWKVLAADGHVTRGVIEFTVDGAAASR